MATPVPKDLEEAGAWAIENLGDGPADYKIRFDESISELKERTVHTYRKMDAVPDDGDGRLIMIRVPVKNPISRNQDPRL